MAVACSDNPTAPSAAPENSGAFIAAGKPVRERINQTFSFELNCGSFTGVGSGGILGYEVTFFDKAGDPVRLGFHFRYRSTITNLASGKTLPDNANYNGTVDLLTGVTEVNGLIYNVKDRENGIRIKDIGRIVFDADGNIIFEAGRHDVGGFGDAASLYCAALA